MLFWKWKNFLQNNNPDNTSSIWSSTSDFFTLPNFMDMFQVNIANSSAFSNSITLFDGFFNHTLNDELSTVSIASMFNNSNYFSIEDISHINTIPSLDELERLSLIKNDVDSMCRVFPSLEEVIEDVDMWARYGEESLQEIDSTPDVKLYYPEPFIASPSFIHEEVWFIHILHYNHWLWFMFISLVMFYFITFINVVRWCNLRNKPKRETRGVSRSKCADLITATVPVSWAASIIISETVDATDYYDGFGTGEIVIGIRAYQWGWEYFYPKGIDLNYSVKPSYSTLVGNSIKYNNSSSSNVDANSLWKSYQAKSLDSLSTNPSHLLLSPSDKKGALNLSDFSKVGLSTIHDSAAFKKIQYFSKTNPQNMFNSSDFYNNKLSKINKLFLSTSDTTNTAFYSTNRQLGTSTNNSAQYNYSTGLDNNSTSKFLKYNFDLQSSRAKASFHNQFTPENASTALSTNKLVNITSSSAVGLDHNTTLLALLNKPASLSLINATSDGKSFSNPMKYLLNFHSKKPSTALSTEPNSDLYSIDYSTSPASELSNESFTNKFKDLKSPNLGFLSSEKNIRLLDKVNATKTNFSLSQHSNNLNSIVANTLLSNQGSNESSLYDNSSKDWLSPDVYSTLASNSFATASSHTPIYSNNSSWSDKSFDAYLKGKDDQTPNLLKSKEETAPSHLFTSYWSTYWSNISKNHRISNMVSSDNFNSNFYLPHITEYAEYDFRNWQALELLEDAFWESTFSSFAQDEYLNILQSNNEHSYFKKQEELFNLGTRHYKFKNLSAYKPLSKSIFYDSSISSSLPIFTEDAVLPTNLTALNNFSSIQLEPTIDAIEESFDAAKYNKFLHFKNYKNLLTLDVPSLSTQSYTRTIDPFRADYEDIVWNYDSSDTNGLFSENLDLDDSRISNTMKLRSTSRNSIVTYNAMQKVFKSRLDESRSNSRLQDFSNSYITHPFISESKTPYESMLAKNKESYFSPQLYSMSKNDNFNTLFSVWNSLNNNYLDIPFLMSAKSDPSRYLWFDWQSRWSSIEVQPASSARYSLSGVPYFNKSYEFDTQSGDSLDESENYLNRLARARKNYMSNWAYSPYFYSRVSNWYKFNDLINSSYSNLGKTKMLLLASEDYWLSPKLSDSSSSVSTPSISGVSTPARSSWRPLSNIQSYYFNTSSLVDILTKREYLYRTYFNSKGYAANLPTYLTASPTNPLLEEVKKGHSLIDPTSFSAEISREMFYQDLNFMKLNLLTNLFKSVNSSLDLAGVNTSSINDYLFYYLFGTNSSTKLGKNLDLYKSQYRPMKKGVTNMVRLQATGAIAMPIEIRLHILASSRDVIHSWAIPSAGIKIDCVPGYSSHRITVFLVSGIFWGQCMEICGRFHHWMPIVVYFMKRDLFFLWCTHFMHYSSASDMFDMTDRQLADKLRLVSFDKTSWVNDINKIL
jgi:heme/copper-type cytochrome/quinol oxidase subunit 2